MHWFFIAIFAPILWSLVNHIDKYLLSKYFKGGGIGVLLIFSSLIGFLLLPIIYLIHPTVFTISPLDALILIGMSTISLCYLLLYFYALDRDETSTVTPLSQMIPIFSYFLGYFALGETLTQLQTFSSLLIIMGAVLISLEVLDKKLQFKKVVFLSMFGHSFLFAVTGLLFKMFAIEYDYFTTVFWGYLGDGLIGLCILIFFKKFRQQFMYVFKKNKKGIIGLNFLNEGLNVGAIMSVRFASLLAPLAIVYTIEAFQPFFVLLFGVLLTMLFPKFVNEKIDKKTLTQKIIAILLMFVGSYLLATSS